MCRRFLQTDKDWIASFVWTSAMHIMWRGGGGALFTRAIDCVTTRAALLSTHEASRLFLSPLTPPSLPLSLSPSSLQSGGLAIIFNSIREPCGRSADIYAWKWGVDTQSAHTTKKQRREHPPHGSACDEHRHSYRVELKESEVSEGL